MTVEWIGVCAKTAIAVSAEGTVLEFLFWALATGIGLHLNLLKTRRLAVTSGLRVRGLVRKFV